MDINTVISGEDLLGLTSRVESFNKTLNPTRQVDRSLGKDDFLKILLTQLTHQDPTKPLEDREFIAQMAQFSTLEQMTNLSAQFGKMQGLLAKGQAVALLGRTVEIAGGGQQLTGVVQAVTAGDSPEILVDGRYYDLSDVVSVKE